MSHENISLDGMLDRCLYAGSMSHEEICKAVNTVFTHTPITPADVDRRIQTVNAYKEQLAKLQVQPGIAQRTPEWYAARNTLITASDFAQAVGQGKFGTQKQFFQKKVGHEEVPFDSSAAPLRWGCMFEPIVNEIYERRNGMPVHEFGLLRHPKHSFLGASPDGINAMGVMVEIKAPYKRKITGEIPFQYALQIQGQLDTCGLTECDYVEASFEDRDYYAPPATGDDEDVAPAAQFEPEAGVCAEYINPDRWEYKAISDSRTVEEWVQTLPPGYVLIHAWRLKKLLVQRVYKDEPFFQQKTQELNSVWDQVLRYKADKDAYFREVGSVKQDSSIKAQNSRQSGATNGLMKLTGYSFL